MYLIHPLLMAEVGSEPLVRINYTEVHDVHYGKATLAVCFTSPPWKPSTEIIAVDIVSVGYRTRSFAF